MGACASAREECAELVAVTVAEVGRVEVIAACPRGAFTLAAQGDGLVVDRIDFGLTFGGQCHHHAVTDGGLVAVGGLDHKQHGRVRIVPPGNELLCFQSPFRADDAQELVVVARGARHIIRTQCDIADHGEDSCLSVGFAGARV